MTWRADTTQEREVAEMFDVAARELGPVASVMVNARIVAPASSLADMDTARLRRIFDVNVLGSYLCAREAARRLPASKGGPGGAIVIVSSMASRLRSPFKYVDHAGAKAALDTLTIGLARNWAATA